MSDVTKVPCSDCGSLTEPPAWDRPPMCFPCDTRRFDRADEIGAHLRQAYPSLGGRAVNAIISSLVTFSDIPMDRLNAGFVVTSVASMSDGEIMCRRMIGRKTLTEIRQAIPRSLGAGGLGCPFCGHALEATSS